MKPDGYGYLEGRLAYRKRYYAEHKEHEKAARRARHAVNRDRENRQSAVWRAANPGYAARWYATRKAKREANRAQFLDIQQGEVQFSVSKTTMKYLPA